MKKIISILITAALLMSHITFASASGEVNIYVSVNGSDTTGDGTASNPYLTLKAAKVAAAEASKSNKVNVIFGGGTYVFNEKVVFSEADSGTLSNPVTYKAADGEEVVFSGSVKLDNSLFEKIEEPGMLQRLPEASRSKVMMLDLSKQGLSYQSVMPVLYADDAMQTISRYPDYGYEIASKADGTADFEWDYENASNWKSSNIQLVGSIENGYRWKTVKVSEISGNTIKLSPLSDASSTIRKDAFFYVRNVLEELNAPGEYMIENGILYYYPIGNIEDLNLEAACFNESYMIILNEPTSHITFEGIMFEKSLSGAIGTASGSGQTENIKIKDCAFKYIMGRNAISLADAKDCVVSDNYAYSLGGRFIHFNGGKRDGLIPGNITVENNRIAMAGLLSANSGVISTGENSANEISIGNTVKNNIIQDSISFSAIEVPGNDNKAQYNEIFNQGRIIDDGGAVYVGRSSTKYGTDISNNYIHDLNKSNNYCGLYADDGYSGINIHHNVVSDAERAMISGVGMNNSFNHNLSINCLNGFQLGSRMSWGAGTYGVGGTLYQETYDRTRNPKTASAIRDAYNAAYPALQSTLDRSPYFAPWNTEVVGNVSFGKVNTITTKPLHKYYNDAGTACLVEGEEAYIGDINKALSAGKLTKSGSVLYVNELKAYGKEVTKNGVDINGTAAGNPRFSYNESYFTDASQQNYTLKNSVSDVSEVHKIDMTKIGINNTSNALSFDGHTGGITLYEPAVDSNGAVIAWKDVETASEYTVTISKNADLSNPVVSDTKYKIFDGNYYTFDCEPGKYYYNVTAHGISRQDSFNITSETGEFEVSSLYTKNLDFALSILNSYIEDAKNTGNENKLSEMSTLYERGQSAVGNASLTQNDIDSLEAEVYNMIDEVSVEYRVTRFEPDLNSTIVYVEGKGFEANSLVSAMVTNPEITFDEAINDATVNSIRYMDTVKADANGKIMFSFDTSVNDIDYTGTYKLYVTDKDGACIEKEYTYGTVELSDITFTDGENPVSVSELASYKGKTLTVDFSVVNRRKQQLNPCMSIGAYENGVLKNVTLSTDKQIPAASKAQNLTITYTVPSDYSDSTEIRFLLWDEGTTMTPLTKVRVINEK